MPTLTLTTDLPAPIERAFDLARSIDLHAHSMAHTKEHAIAGKTTGLIDLHDTVTWQARHPHPFGITQRLTSRITDLRPPTFFADEMVPRAQAGHGAFRSFRHEHHFERLPPLGPAPLTRMTDTFTFESPFGPLGRAVNALFLTAYMRRLLEHRNRALYDALATDAWRRYLPPTPDPTAPPPPR